MFAQHSPLLLELAALERLNPKLVARELQPVVDALRARVKVCYRCASETIGERKPKRRQRTFCSPACSAAQRQEDFSVRQSHVSPER